MVKTPLMRGTPALVSIALFGCTAARVPCTGPAACGAGGECLANRCVEPGAEVVSRGSERIVLEPTELAVIAQNAAHSGLPGAVTFGSRALGRTALYMKFKVRDPEPSAIESAFILLEPMPNTAADARDIEVEAWRVRKSWDRSSVTWSAQPALGLPKADAVARGAPRQPLRVDVTEIVRYVAERAPYASDYGVALVAGSGDGHGASFSTGTSGVRGPRLEIYVRPARERRAR